MLRTSTIVALLVIMFTCRPACLAAIVPPGKFTWRGLVVKRADGQPALSYGRGCHTFPKKLHKQLEPHVGKFVRVDFVTVNDPKMFSLVPTIDRIERLTVLARGPDALPVVVEIAPGKKSFRAGEPLRMTVTVTNKTKRDYPLQWNVPVTSLCRDYKEKVAFESQLHYISKHPELKRMATLKAGNSFRYTVVCRQMPQPGTDQLLHALHAQKDDGLSLQSRIHSVTILPPIDEAERLKALRSWLDRVAPEHRSEIAVRLLVKGDARGREIMIKSLSVGRYADPNAITPATYRFLWQHGGKAGESALLARIAKQTKQDSAARTIELVYLSPNRVELLSKLLDDRHPTRRDISGWVEQPRVCDITAAWLAGHTEGKLRFPKAGTEKQRDAVVGRVREQLAQQPEFFVVLSKSYGCNRSPAGRYPLIFQ